MPQCSLPSSYRPRCSRGWDASESVRCEGHESRRLVMPGRSWRTEVLLRCARSQPSARARRLTPPSPARLPRRRRIRGRRRSGRLRVAGLFHLTFRPIETGLSGGVTLLGSSAMIAGALCIAVVASLLRIAPLLPVAAAGIAGALLDSLAGAGLQARQWCPRCSLECETPRHHCGTPTTMRRGVRWIKNDVVNLMATLCGAIVAALVVR